MGDTRFKIQVETGSAYIKNACFYQNMKEVDIRLEIQIRAGYACIKSACISSTYAKDIYIWEACTGDTCVSNFFSMSK